MMSDQTRFCEILYWNEFRMYFQQCTIIVLLFATGVTVHDT